MIEHEPQGHSPMKLLSLKYKGEINRNKGKKMKTIVSGPKSLVQ